MIVRVQVRLDTDKGEGDVADFVSEFRKNEKHAMVVSALRSYMRFVGYYDRKGNRFLGIGKVLKETEAENTAADLKSSEYLEAEKDLLSMFPQGSDDDEDECADSATK